MEKIKVKTVVVGAGISGLSVAHFINKKHEDFLVLEAQGNPGGIIQTKLNSEFVCENGPNTILLNNDAIVELIKDCELWSEIKYPIDSSNKNRFVLLNNKLVNIPTSFFTFIKSPLLSIRSKLRLFFEILIKKHKGNTNVYEFISKRFGKEFHDVLIVPFVSGIYAGNTKNMSVKHTLKILWNLEQKYGSVIMGLFKLKKKKIKSFSFPKGTGQLINKIADDLNSKIKYNFKVKKVSKIKNGFEIISNTDSIINCKEIIYTVPAYVLKNIISDTFLSNQLK